MGELCYTKKTIEASDKEFDADVSDRAAEPDLWRCALRCVWYCAGSDRTKGAYRKKKGVKAKGSLGSRGEAGPGQRELPSVFRAQARSFAMRPEIHRIPVWYEWK